MRILVDMDSILADFLEGLWDAIEEDIGFRGDTGKVTDFYRIQDGLPEEARALLEKRGTKIEDYFYKEGFFVGLKPIAGALKVLKLLVEDGHEVVIVSTPSSESSYVEKVRWLKRHCPFLPHKNVFLGHHKHMVQGDILIDDANHNAAAYRKAWPNAKTFTIALPYNHSGFYDGRFDGWQDPETAWMRIYGAICAIASTATSKR